MRQRDGAIRGERLVELPPASKRFPEGRVCGQPGCGTRLSTYNRRDKCWMHAQPKTPRLRGRKARG